MGQRMSRTRHTLLVLALTAGLWGCGYITHDKTHDPALKALVGESFVTVQDAALIRDACVPNYDAKDCQQLQVLGGYYYARGGEQGWHQVRVPADQPGIAAAIAAGGKLTLVPKGTGLTIVQVVSRSLGEERRCWLVYATLAGGAPHTVVEVPACFQWAPESTPLWFQAQMIPDPEDPNHKHQIPEYENLSPLPVALYLAAPDAAQNP
jgi:hypothetical protein